MSGKWRLLNAGEILNEGDQWYCHRHQQWLPIELEEIGRPFIDVGTIHRRRMIHAEEYAGSLADIAALVGELVDMLPDGTISGRSVDEVIGELREAYHKHVETITW